MIGKELQLNVSRWSRCNIKTLISQWGLFFLTPAVPCPALLQIKIIFNKCHEIGTTQKGRAYSFAQWAVILLDYDFG